MVTRAWIPLVFALGAAGCAGQTITASYESGGARTIPGTPPAAMTTLHVHDDGSWLAAWAPRLMGFMPPPPPPQGDHVQGYGDYECRYERYLGNTDDLFEICEHRRVSVYVPPTEQDWANWKEAVAAWESGQRDGAPRLDRGTPAVTADLSITLPVGDVVGAEYAVLVHRQYLGLLGVRHTDLAVGVQGGVLRIGHEEDATDPYLMVSTAVAGRYTGSITRLLAVELGIDLNVFPATGTVRSPSLLHGGLRLMAARFLVRGKLTADTLAPDRISLGLEVGRAF